MEAGYELPRFKDTPLKGSIAKYEQAIDELEQDIVYQKSLKEINVQLSMQQNEGIVDRIQRELAYVASLNTLVLICNEFFIKKKKYCEDNNLSKTALKRKIESKINNNINNDNHDDKIDNTIQNLGSKLSSVDMDDTDDDNDKLNINHGSMLLEKSSFFEPYSLKEDSDKFKDQFKL